MFFLKFRRKKGRSSISPPWTSHYATSDVDWLLFTLWYVHVSCHKLVILIICKYSRSDIILTNKTTIFSTFLRFRPYPARMRIMETTTDDRFVMIGLPPRRISTTTRVKYHDQSCGLHPIATAGFMVRHKWLRVFKSDLEKKKTRVDRLQLRWAHITIQSLGEHMQGIPIHLILLY